MRHARAVTTRGAAAVLAVAFLAACVPGGSGPAGQDAVEEEPPAEGEANGVGATDDGEGNPSDAGPPPPEAPPHGHPPGDVEPFTDGEELARSLAAAERALADADTPEEDVGDWAAVHQQAHRDLAGHPRWREAAREAVPSELHEGFDLTLHAVEQLLELTEPQPQLPDWRIERPPSVEELRRHYLEAEEEFGVPWTVLAAIHLVESRFGRIQGDSHAGAQGPMQFMPGTWEEFGEGDVHDPRDAILAAGRYLAASGAPEDLEAAVFAYNRSERYVEAVLSHARAMEAHDHYLDVYHGWRVYYRTVDGDVVLEPEDG